MLPGPLGLVEHFNRDKGNLSNPDFDWLLRLADNNGSLLLPLGSLFTKCTSIEMIFILSGSPFILWIEPAHESSGDHVDHVISEIMESASSPGTPAASSAASAESSMVMTVALGMRLLCFDLLILRVLVFIDGSYDHGRGVFGLGDLEERVLVRLSLLAGLAEVEVLAH
jgi:hypothetical protein